MICMKRRSLNEVIELGDEAESVDQNFLCVRRNSLLSNISASSLINAMTGHVTITSRITRSAR